MFFLFKRNYKLQQKQKKLFSSISFYLIKILKIIHPFTKSIIIYDINNYLVILEKIFLGIGWTTESLFIFRKNNTQFLLLNRIGFSRIIKDYVIHEEVFFFENSIYISDIISSRTTGHFGFEKNERKTLITSDLVLIYGFTFIRIYGLYFSPILFKIRGRTKVSKRYFREFILNLKETEYNDFGIYGGGLRVNFGYQKIKHIARKRYRFYVAQHFKCVLREVNQKDFKQKRVVISNNLNKKQLIILNKNK